MKNYLYLWADGQQFDPQKFLESMAENRCGFVKSTKVRDGEILRIRNNTWQSERVEFSAPEIDSVLRRFLISMNSILPLFEKHKAERVVVEIVGYIDDIDDIQGYFLSKETLGLLSGSGAAIDIDLYPLR